MFDVLARLLDQRFGESADPQDALCLPCPSAAGPWLDLRMTGVSPNMAARPMPRQGARSYPGRYDVGLDMTWGWITQLVGSYGYYAVFTLIALESMGIPLPGETALITAALYSGTTHHLNIAALAATAAAAAVIGDNAGYWIGRTGGLRLAERYGRLVGLDRAKLKVGRYLFARHGVKVVFAGRFIAVLRTFAAFFAGVEQDALARLPGRERGRRRAVGRLLRFRRLRARQRGLQRRKHHHVHRLRGSPPWRRPPPSSWSADPCVDLRGEPKRHSPRRQARAPEAPGLDREVA